MSSPVATAWLDRSALRAPEEHASWLVIPPWNQWEDLLEHNLRCRRNYPSDGPLDWPSLLQQAQEELLQAAWQHTTQYRQVQLPAKPRAVLLAGHQPQLFHVGVWFKNYVLHQAAKHLGAVGVNLVIDSDVMHRVSVPVPGGNWHQPQRRWIRLDDPLAQEIPYELRRVQNPELFTGFGSQVAQTVRELVPRPMIEPFWPVVLERYGATGLLGEALAQGRHAWEALWQWQTLELPLGRVCSLPSFMHLVACILLEAPRFWHIYNQAVLEYRRRHRLRSRTHPSPLLGQQASWWEMPFWTYSASLPQRRGLWVQLRSNEVLLSDGQTWQVSLPAQHDRLVQGLIQLDAQGRRFRTRALTTTLWARMVLGDLFIHGIGGAKYDEVTEHLAREFFGVSLPAMMVATATFWIPGANRRLSLQELGWHKHLLRQVGWQPDRFLPESLRRNPPEQLQRLLEQKHHWISQAPSPQRHQILMQLNQQLMPWVADVEQELQARWVELQQRWEVQEVLTWREYPFCVFPEEKLRDFFLAFPAPKA